MIIHVDLKKKKISWIFTGNKQGTLGQKSGDLRKTCLLIPYHNLFIHDLLPKPFTKIELKLNKPLSDADIPASTLQRQLTRERHYYTFRSHNINYKLPGKTSAISRSQAMCLINGEADVYVLI